jgi:cytochrome c
MLSLGLLCALSRPVNAVPIEEVLRQIDPATGKPKDTSTVFSVSGLVSARAGLAGDKVLAFVQPVGGTGLPVLVGGADAAKLVNRNDISVTGTLAEGPLGLTVLVAKEGTVSVTATNRSPGSAEPRGAEFFKDASALAGRFVSLTNVAFVEPTFDGSGRARVKSDAGEVKLLLTTTLKDRPVPAGAQNIFGVPVKVGGEWQLLAARFLSVSNKASLALATKRTCITCHTPDTKVVGPAYRDVAAHYKDDPDAIGKLTLQMEKGGGGRWGVVAMPALGAMVPPEERHRLAEWIWGYRWDTLLSE